LDLALDERGVDGAAAVVRRPDALDLPDAGLDVDVHLDDVRAEAVGGRGADGAAAVVAAELLGAVAAGRAERAELRLGELHRLAKAHALALARAAQRAERAVDLAGLHAPRLGDRLRDHRPQPL